MPNKTLVPDKLQGYLLQVKHMLFELISVDDRIVSIEKLDDVAVEADGKVIAEQVKSVTSANNPIAERSSVFWKTLYNWCTYIETGVLPSGAIMRFVVVSNGIVTPGGIQASFMNAHSDDEAKKRLPMPKKLFCVQHKVVLQPICMQPYQIHTESIYDTSLMTAELKSFVILLRLWKSRYTITPMTKIS